MLNITDNAAEVVKKITEQNIEADDAGLRISQGETGEEPTFALTPAEEPEPGDKVVEEGGARVFLDEAAATTLDDKILDAQVDPDGSVQFAVGQQA